MKSFLSGVAGTALKWEKLPVEDSDAQWPVFVDAVVRVLGYE